MSNISLFGRLGPLLATSVLLATGVVGCASEADSNDDEGSPILTSAEALSSDSCSAGSHNGYALKAYVKKGPNSDTFNYYFHGIPGTIHSNAHITWHDKHGKTGYYDTADNIHDRVWSLRFAHPVGGDITDVGPGSQAVIHAVFDIPGTADKSCTMSLTW